MTTQDEAVIEAVARDLCAEGGNNPDEALFMSSDRTFASSGPMPGATLRPRWEMHIARAARIVGRLRRWEAENGWQCVPVKHTEAMDDAAGWMTPGEWSGVLAASPPPPGADTSERQP